MLKHNNYNACVIWITTEGSPLPPNETLTITIKEYATPWTTVACAFSVLEVDPDGREPEIGSGLTFYEVPTEGGETLPKEATRLNLVLPTRARTLQMVPIKLSVMDQQYCATPDFTGTVYLQGIGQFVDLPRRIDFTPADQGSITIWARTKAEGIIRLIATSGSIECESNPCVTTNEPPEEQVYFGEYHKHTIHCDGYQEPEEVYDYARRTAFLDFGVVSSHDMMPFPRRGARNWDELHAETEAAHEPEDFVTFQGYEWTHGDPFSADDARGHKVVIFLNPNHLLPLIPYCYSETDPEFMPPTTLFNRLLERAGEDVIVIPHHLPLYKWWIFPSAGSHELGGPLPALTREEVDRMQPVAEVFSRIHGSNESREMQDWIKSPTTFGGAIFPTFWQDALKEGVRAGAVCAGDNHVKPMGHPTSTALTGIMAPSLTREDLFRAIQNRRTYGTSGPRLFIDFRIGSRKMGDISKADDRPPKIEATVIGSLVVDQVEVVKVTRGLAQVPYTAQGTGKKTLSLSWEDAYFDRSQWACYYLRIHLDQDAHGAWTSPIWLEP